MLLCFSGGEPTLAASNRCTISPSPMVFGSCYPFSSADTLTTGTIVYNCTTSTPIIIDIDAGGGRSFNPRGMKRGAAVLDCNLYLDPSRTAIWGDGTGGPASI